MNSHRYANFARTPFVVYTLLLILAGIHMYVTHFDPYERVQFYLDYANSRPEILDGEYYRLFTSMFLHVDMAHLFSNGLGLFILGAGVEEIFGHTRFLLIYLLGGLAGSVASFVITGGASVGASGAVFAVFGALATYFFVHRHQYGKVAVQQLRSMAMLAILNLGIGLLSNNLPGSPIQIDNAAHIGGAVGGLLLAWMIGPRYERRMGIDITGQPVEQLIDTSRLSYWLPALCVYIVMLVAIFAIAL